MVYLILTVCSCKGTKQRWHTFVRISGSRHTGQAASPQRNIHLRQKQFVIMKNKFYYCDFKKRVEGSLNELERAEKLETGMIIYAKEEKMEIFCTLERYKNSLLEKLSLRREEK